MAEFRKAPDGQPTSNIKLQLSTAIYDVADWQRYVKELTTSLDHAKDALAKREHRKAELEWQLEQRKSQEVNGL